jgi:hypothetical protein
MTTFEAHAERLRALIAELRASVVEARRATGSVGVRGSNPISSTFDQSLSIEIFLLVGGLFS